MPQLESYARRGGRDTAGGPTNMEELHSPACCMFPSPHAYPIYKVRGFDFQSVTVPLRVGFKWRTEVTSIILMPQTCDWRVCFRRRRKRKAAKHQQNCTECNA